MVMDTLHRQLAKVAAQVERRDHELDARAIGMKQAYLRSQATVRLVKKDYGFLCVAEVASNPTGVFWFLILLATLMIFVFGIGLFVLCAGTGVYFWSKRRVRVAMSEALARVKDEVA